MSERPTIECAGCGESIEEDNFYSSQNGDDLYHDECWFSEFDYASNVWIIQGGGQALKVLVCSHGTYDGEYLEDYDGALTISRAYHRTDGWRGYYETRVEGFEEVEAGWTTGNWGDAISASKQDFNTWAQSLIEGKVTLPEGLTVVLAFDPTSNVFSTAAGVFTNDADLFAQALSVPAGL